MADAFKCDGCGDYRDDKPAFQGEPYVKRPEDQSIDLCRDCFEAFREWLDKRP